jgi:methionyl-tRNA formyltransferase
MNTRIVFMGSPNFAVPALESLSSNYQVIGVVTQPDRPSGRGQKSSASPVKLAAQELRLPVIHPRRLREPEAMEQLHAWNPDLIIVVAFGQILRQEVLVLPQGGCINVHASLLPRWRGAAPIQAAILNGDIETGITIMKMDAGVDTGPILRQRSVNILPSDNANSLGQTLSIAGANLLIETLPLYLGGNLNLIQQDESKMTLAPMLSKEDGLLELSKTANQLTNQVRAMNPWPGAFLIWHNQILKIHAAQLVNPQPEYLEDKVPFPGKRIIQAGFPCAITGEGIIMFTVVQPAGKKIMSGKDFLLGNKDWIG